MRTCSNSVRTVAALLCGLVWASAAGADVPQILHYQGILSDTAGTPVHCLADGSCADAYHMTFRLYAGADGGEPLFEQSEEYVEISEGVFEVTLGAQTPIPLTVVAGADLFLGLTINETSELIPRLRVASSAFALKAQHAVSATTADQASDADTVGGLSPEDFLTPAEVEQLLDDKGFCTSPCYGDLDVGDYLAEYGYSPGPHYTDADVANYLSENGYGPGMDAVVNLSPLTPGPNCPAGGVQVVSGYDSDESGSLAGDEITNTAYVCHGAAGTEGSVGEDGLPGVGVQSATVNGAGQLEIILSNGSTSLSQTLIGPPGDDGALTGLECETDDIIALGEDGWECAQDANTTYTGAHFALSNQECEEGLVVSGVDPNGAVLCVADLNTDLSYTASGGVARVGNDFHLDSTGCAAGSVWKWTGTAWNCAPDSTQTYVAGDGLSLDGSTFSIHSSGCSGGQVLKRNGDNTAWICAGDDSGAGEYTASLGITRVGNDFRLDSTDCQAGYVLKWNGSDWDCVVDTDTTYDGTHFALSNQGCADGLVVSGVDTSGAVVCVADLNSHLSYTASGGVARVGNDFRLDSTDCQAGHVLKWNGSDWSCAPDSNQTYLAGDGLSLDGSTFSIHSSGCSGGQVLKRNGDNTAWICAADDSGAGEYTASLGVTRVGNDFRLDATNCIAGHVLKWNGTDWDCVIDTDTTYDGTDFALSSQGCASDEYMVGVDANGLVVCEEYIDRSLIPVVTDALTAPAGSTGAFNFKDLALGATSPHSEASFHTVLPEPQRVNSPVGIQEGAAVISSLRHGSGGDADTEINIDLTSRIPHDLVTARATVTIDEIELTKTGTKSWYNVFLIELDTAGNTANQLYLNVSSWKTTKSTTPNVTFTPKVGHRYVLRVIMSCFSTAACPDALTNVRVAGRWDSGLQQRVTGECGASGHAIKKINEDGSVVCDTGLQRRVVGTCNPGSSIRSIAANGTVTCETDDSGSNLSPGPGLTIIDNTIQIDESSTITVNSIAISPRTRWHNVHVADFQQTGTETQSKYELGTGSDYMMFSGAETFVAPVRVPHGTQATELRCYLYDTDGFNNISINARLRRRGYTTNSWTTVATLGFATSSQGASTTIQSSNVSVDHSIDNNAYSYSLQADISASTATSINPGLRFYGCRLQYTQNAF